MNARQLSTEAAISFMLHQVSIQKLRNPKRTLFRPSRKDSSLLAETIRQPHHVDLAINLLQKELKLEVLGIIIILSMPSRPLLIGLGIMQSPPAPAPAPVV
ncbi:hypothetical protein BGAL_0150g00090 [Botrytis galanthina]|uniref:Uncharacterized protein n=1 Tax=Botrytis galanthina TaxID=278940 RepID=A0A4S8R2Z0_9HELO|nr:hypothetical protein BGAL_0150g00090 [Botrytis galanthina]